MATAPQPVSPANSGRHRTVITVAVIVAVIGLIIFSAIWVRRHSPIRRLDELQLQAELQRSGLRRRRRQQEQREKGIGISLLQSIPVVKYDGDPGKIRRTKSLDLEKGHQNRDAHNWSLEQSQHNIKEMHAEMMEIGKTPHRKEKEGNQKKSDLESEEPECPICTQPFVKNEFLRVLPCGHRHHQRCVDRWLLGFGGTCPVCRVHMDSFYLQSAEPLDLPMKPEPVVVTGEDLEDSHHHRPDL
ncbi:uncharacterized protein Z519_08485 [Cladophialophora bantiana CBS 173.52]|uniref:RING-type domain-containing protein n=1 Tax=Cladophialophora bantiana (strain ATCC 10958 / CBS 173.52 / CDC B-1940 / NIH 8579) TaxID=1442370 RepID=A0A0D2FVY4_CLAB1|nr:uncharacterized protein Z519_08485 [Cladophialophora bantiana CBS 173.52]KIW90702.1 hypothetical protein Z519_08485 [Cladophialophora bantiana CBS 173.52]